jgi:hypothetical protein
VLGTISVAKVDTIYEILAKKRNWPPQGHLSRGFLVFCDWELGVPLIFWRIT